jgi:hypothetical protein
LHHKRPNTHIDLSWYKMRGYENRRRRTRQRGMASSEVGSENAYKRLKAAWRTLRLDK